MFFWATEKEKRRALSEFEIRFLPDEEKCKTKMEVQFAFPLQRKTENENTIWVSFSYAIENRLALRHTDYCSIIVLVFGSSSMYSPGHTSILAAKIVSLTFLSELRTKTAIPIRSVQSVDCIPGKKCRLVTKCRLQIADRVQNADWQFVLFFVWYLITCLITTYRTSRKRFSAIIFHDYLHYCRIFLACFLITIVLNIISSLI